VLRVGLQIDASGPATGLTSTRRVELVDPRRHAIDRLGVKLGAVADWHP
jgi:hypothetical protein